MKVKEEYLNKEYSSKMELLGLINPFISDQYAGKKTIVFKSERSQTPEFTRYQKWNRDLSMQIDAIDRIRVPKLDKEGKIVVNKFTEEVVTEEATILYIPGMKSIFLNEIVDESGGEKVADLYKRAAVINFSNEERVCQSNEVTLVAFLRACSWNKNALMRRGDAAIKFYEDDKILKDQEYLKKNLAESKILQFVTDSIATQKNAPLWAIFSSFKNLPIRECKSRYEIPTMYAEMHKLAKGSPHIIQNLVNESHGMKKIYLLEAIDREIIRLAGDRWLNKIGTPIAHLAAGSEPVESLVLNISVGEFEKVKEEVGDILGDLTRSEKARDVEIDRLTKELEQARKEAGITAKIPAEQLKTLSLKGDMPTKEEIETTIKELADEKLIEFTPPMWYKSEHFPRNKDGEPKNWKASELAEHYVENPQDYGRILTVLQPEATE